MATTPDLLDRFGALQVWQRRGERAPHKPLLVLLALGRLLRDGARALPYREVDDVLGRLLREFGPPRRAVHPEYPFWRLQNDGLWEVRSHGPMRVREGNSDPPRSELLRYEAEGGFRPEVTAALLADRALSARIAQAVLDAHFPASVHDDILQAVGLEGLAGALIATVRRARDPRFRARVLTAWEHRCAICGLDVRIGGIQLGLDAAHIMWHQAGGPEVEDNGLALCVLHHKLFDRGALTVSPECRVVLSEHVHGGTGFDDHVLRYHGQPLGRVQDPRHRPAPAYLEWHHRQVFQQPARSAGPAHTCAP